MFIMITGGAASGKSAYAEELLSKHAQKNLYLATMQPFGENAQKKIQRHHLLRAQKGFETIEQYINLNTLSLSQQYDGILLECMSNLLANEMFSCDPPNTNVVKKIVDSVLHLQKYCKTMVVVTNEVFANGKNYSPETIEYMKNLGEINQILCHYANVVYYIVCGIPVLLKGERIGCTPL